MPSNTPSQPSLPFIPAHTKQDRGPVHYTRAAAHQPEGSMGHVIEISQHSLRSHPLCLLVLLNLSVSDKDTIIRQSENIHISRNFGHLLCLTYRENKCYSCFNKTVVEICASTTRLNFPFLIPKWKSLYQIYDENHL